VVSIAVNKQIKGKISTWIILQIKNVYV